MVENDSSANQGSEFSGQELSGQLQQLEGKGLGFFARRKAKRLYDARQQAVKEREAAMKQVHEGRVEEKGVLISVPKKPYHEALAAGSRRIDAEMAAEKHYEKHQEEYVNDALKDANKAGVEINLESPEHSEQPPSQPD